MNALMNKLVDVWITDGHLDEWKKEWMGGWMDGEIISR